MTDPANLDSVGIWANEEDTVVTNAQTEVLLIPEELSRYPGRFVQSEEAQRRYALRRACST